MSESAVTSSVPPAAPRGGRGGLVALVLGIIALIASLIPFLSYIAWAVAIAAVIVGIVALTRGLLRKGGAVAGIVLGVVALVLSIVMSVVYTLIFFIAAAASSASTDGPAATLPPASELPSASALPTASPTAGQRSVTYIVRGSGRATTISYLVADASGGGTDQVSDVALPWSKTIGIKDASVFSSTVFSLVVQGGADGGKVTCAIKANGKTISKHSASGAYAVATCSGTAD